jgi:hypothetical protein
MLAVVELLRDDRGSPGDRIMPPTWLPDHLLERSPHPATVAQPRRRRPAPGRQTPPHAATVPRQRALVGANLNRTPAPQYTVEGKGWDKVKTAAGQYKISDDQMKWLKIAKFMGMPPPMLGHASTNSKGSAKKTDSNMSRFVTQMKELTDGTLTQAWSTHRVGADGAW